MTMQDQTHRADASTEPVTARPAQSPDASERAHLGDAAGRRPEHRAGAQRRAVPRHRHAAVARPAEVDRRGAGGGAQPAAARRAAAARRRGRRPRRPSSCTRSAAWPASCATSPRRTATTTSCARASSASACASSCPAIRSSPRASSASRSRRPHARDRGPPVPPEGTGAGGPAAAAAGAAGADQRRAGGERPSQAADLVASFMDLQPEEKQQILETFDLRPAGQGPGAARAPHRGAQDLARHRPADPRMRSRAASASTSCASS